MSGHEVDIKNIRRVLINTIARERAIPPGDVSADITFNDLGVDSITIIELVIDLNEAFPGLHVTPALLAENPTVDATAHAVHALLRAG